MTTTKQEVRKLLSKIPKKKGYRLDIGCGSRKMEGFVGMDVRAVAGVDVVHNIEKFPWPFDDETFSLAHASHLLEHVNPASTDPKLVGLIDLLIKKKILSRKEVGAFVGEYPTFGGFIRFMDEVWRILEPEGQFMFVVPYAGSMGFWQDPTHLNPISEVTILYFDPEHPSGLWKIYKPKPWKIEVNTFQAAGNLEVVISKRVMKKEYEQKWQEGEYANQ